jgi:hypothetical protein
LNKMNKTCDITLLKKKEAVKWLISILVLHPRKYEWFHWFIHTFCFHIPIKNSFVKMKSLNPKNVSDFQWMFT